MPKILVKRGTATQWTNSTTPLLNGEIGFDSTNNVLKVGNGTSLWNSLSGITIESSGFAEIAQDSIATAFSNGTHSNITVTYNDNSNSISLGIGPDVITTTSLNNTLTNSTTGYVPIADVGQPDGVASLDSTGLIPDSQIPSTIARDSEIPNLTGYATETYVNTAVSNLVDSAPTTLNTLNELAAALGDDANYATTISTALGLKAPLASPTFTGTVSLSGATVTGLPFATPLSGGYTYGKVDPANKNYSIGQEALSSLTSGSYNTAMGYVALKFNTSGNFNTVVGADSLVFNTTGYNNTVLGGESLRNNTIGNDNTAVGEGALNQNVSGSGNSAFGQQSLFLNTASNNTAYGYLSGKNLTTGSNNIIIGYDSQSSSSSSSNEITLGNASISRLRIPGLNIDYTILNKPLTSITEISTKSTSYALQHTDGGKLIEMSNGGILTIIDSGNFPVGFTVDVLQTGSSQVTIAGDGFTPNATPGLKLRAQWSSATLVKRGLNSWVVMGDLSA